MVDLLLAPLHYQFMVSALQAGTLVAVAAGVVGWFVVLRKQAFASHTLATVGFTGAAGAGLVGAPAWLGYLGFSVLAGAVISLSGRRRATTPGATDTESAVVATVLALALACGYLFVTLYRGNIQGIASLLFGNFLGITPAQVQELAVATVVVLAIVAIIARRLFFATLDPDVAHVSGVRVGALGTLFLVLLGVTAAEASQITGALLVFALLILPAATAQTLAARPSRSLLLTVLLGLAITWLGLLTAYYTALPIGACITSLGFATFVLAHLGRWLLARTGRRSAAPFAASPAGAA